jgi:hypothetical protein
MTKNIIKSEDVTSKKTNKKIANKDDSFNKKNIDLKNLSSSDKQVVYFESGVAYLMPNGFKFTRQNRMKELPIEEASRLLKLDNFRLPSDEEKQMYYNSLEE